MARVLIVNQPQIKKGRYIILVSLVSKVKTVSATDYLAEERGETAQFRRLRIISVKPQVNHSIACARLSDSTVGTY